MIDKELLDRYLNNKNIVLSKTEKLVHDYVLTNCEQVLYESLSRISAMADVGEATIVRYFKKLGYDSFVIFKMAVYKAVEDIRTKKDAPFIDNITENMIDVINQTKQIVNLEQIEKASEIILGSNKIFVSGMGTSYTTALDMFSKLIRVGVNATVLNDSHFSYMYSAILDGESCVIIYSFSGETDEMIKLAKNCKDRDVKIIVISNYDNSTLFSLCDVFIKTAGFEKEINGGFFCSKVSQIYVCDILVSNCALKNVEKTKKYNQLVTNSIL